MLSILDNLERPFWFSKRNRTGLSVLTILADLMPVFREKGKKS